MPRRRPNRGGFSLKRATGVTRMKARISRATGVPVTRSGRQRKVGKMLMGPGCLVFVVAVLSVAAAIWLVV